MQGCTGPRPLIMTRISLSILVVALLWAGAALAHNGRLALAPSAEGIVVDGDLSDWPEHLPRYPITNPAFGEPPTDAEDLTATFRVAYSETDNRLLVAIEVVDESVVDTAVQDLGQPGDWDDTDGCEVYLDVSHGRGSAYQLSLYGHTPAVTGSYGNMPERSELFQVESFRRPGRQTYEWWIDVGQLGDRQTRLERGTDLAFDIVVADRDADGSFTWLSWGPDALKLAAARQRLGDLLVVGGGATLGEAIADAGDIFGATMQRAEREARSEAVFLTFLAGALLAVTLLHLMLYAFQRQSPANLYYAVFTGVTAVSISLAYLLPSASLTAGTFNQVLQLWFVVVYAASLLLLYSQFHGRVTRSGKWLLAWLAYAAVARFFLGGGWPAESSLGWLYWLLAAFGYGALVASFITIGGLVFGAVSRRREGAWSVGVSFLLFAWCAGIVVYRLMNDQPLHPMLLAAILLPLAAMSYRLARTVAGVHSDLARRYEEVESLSAQLRDQNRVLELANIKIREQSHQVEAANRLKSDFLARMSHDLRTPLNAIIGYTRILLRRLQGDIDPRQYRNLDNIRISADNLLALINDILDLSRIESGRTELTVDDVDVRQLAVECAAAVESLVPASVELVTELNGVATVRTDGDRLRRVLMNLLGNAVKYTEAGRITLGLRPEDDGVELTVADTGVGIPAGDLPHIFDEFRQVERKDKKREGSGLGLAIASRSVAMLGGTIEAASIVGEGSTFTVRVPAEIPEEEDGVGA